MKPNRKHPKAPRRDNATHTKRSRPLTGWKRWAFPLAAMLVIPASAILLLELALGLVGYGYPTQFLIPQTVNGTQVYTENRQYGWRYFPRHTARTPASTILPMEKPKEAYRVFILGESAAMGDPDPAFGIPRVIDVLLTHRHRDRKIEVVNAAMTGISSHVIRDIARDCARFQPDCFVVYMGNNEAIGPYGPGTVFSHASRFLALTRFSIALQSAKTAQLAQSLLTAHDSTASPEGWGGLRVFMNNSIHPSDHRIQRMGDHFQANLEDICQAGAQAGAKVILCTVASNLSDCAPFASLHRPGLAGDQLSAWEAALTKAKQFQNVRNWSGAIAAYEQATPLDPEYADVYFAKAGVEDAIGQTTAAHESLLKARDLDALQFRTSSDLNARIRTVATRFENDKARLVDIVQKLTDDNPTTAPGKQYFVDHVHFNFHGNYLAAREICDTISSGISASIPAPLLTESECAQHLAYTKWDQHRITEHMLGRYKKPPFSTRSDNAQRVQHLENQLTQLKDATTSPGLADAAATYRKAIAARPKDYDLKSGLAELLSVSGNFQEEAALRKELWERFPYDSERRATYAESSARAGNYAVAQEHAKDLLKDDPDNVVARHALAISHEKQGRTAEAIAEYNEVLRRRPDIDDVRHNLNALAKRENVSPNGTASSTSPARPTPGSSNVHYENAQAQLEKGNVAAAEREFRAALDLKANFAEAHLELAGILSTRGQHDEAINHYREALKAKPDYAAAHNNLGALLTALNQTTEAQEHLNKALQIQPDYEDAEYNIGLNLLQQQRYQEALAHYEKLAPKRPQNHKIPLQLGTIHEAAGRWAQAAASYQEALKLQPADAVAQNAAAWILATSPVQEVRNGAEAVRLAQAASKAAGNRNASTLDTLAAALAETGQFAEAIKIAQEAASLARTAGDAPLAQQVEERIPLYSQQQAYRSKATTPAVSGTVPP